MEIQMEFEDCSLWHHLIFVEELVNADNDEKLDADDDDDDEKLNDADDVFCWLCKEKALGPIYKCLECDFIQHQSCPDLTGASKRKRRHELKDRHHLILTEVAANTDEEEVACKGCEKPASFLTYKCSIPDCPFLLHKSCTQLSHAVQHPLVPNGLLTLQAPSYPNVCDACRKRCGKLLFYRNSLRNFDMHMECLNRWRIKADDCYEHEVTPTRKPIPFTCEACGEKNQDTAFLCSICRLLTHPACVAFERKVKAKGHNHFLYRTYSVHQVRKHDRIFCNLCRIKVNSEYGAYYCQDCDYTIHLSCARYSASQSHELDNPTCDFVYLLEGTNAMEDERVGPREISHFSHPNHDLILCYEEPRDDMRCEVCVQRIVFAPFYSCQQCKFFLHWKCAKIPRTVKRELFHNHPLILLSEQSYNETSIYGLFRCKCCHRERHGFIYKCSECEDFQLDVQCCLVPEHLEHELHEHTLFLAVRGGPFPGDGPFNCDGCDFYKSVRRAFKCTDCRFHLCFRCVTLPPVAKHRYDTHLLRLTLGHDDGSGDNYCLICEKERDPSCLFYYCKKCDFTAHSHCLIGKNPYIKPGRACMEKLYHEHLLNFVETTEDSPPCDVCGRSFAIGGTLRLDHPNYLALECTQCKLIIHYGCRHRLRDHKRNDLTWQASLTLSAAPT